MINRRIRLYTYLGAIFVAIYSSLPAYINSSFLKNFFSEDRIGYVYALSSVLAIIFMTQIPGLIKRLGNRRVMIYLASFGFISLLLLSLSNWNEKLGAPFVLLFFCLFIIFGYLVRYALDIYLENVSENKLTGLIRGLYLTAGNLAWLISPFVATRLALAGHYGYVYALAALLLIPFFFVLIFKLKETGCTSCAVDRTSLYQTIKCLWQDKTKRIDDLRHILVIDFLLNFFFAIMVVYMPLYLHNHLALAWNEIGLIFSIMLIPFVILEIPLGEIADRWLGEKEILIGGIIITALATIACFLLEAPIWWLWAILLFLTRVGAATTEVMKEAYLFKKTSSQDAGIIALSRINVPLSYLIGPIFASLILSHWEMPYVFLALGLIMLVGLKFAGELTDTK